MNTIQSLELPKFVGHYIISDQVPPIEAIKYEYLLAGNGLFIRAKRNEFSVCLPISEITVKELPKASCQINWNIPEIPKNIWREILSNAREGLDSIQFREDVYVVCWNKKDLEWRWKNIGTNRTYASAIADDSLEEYNNTCLEIHTHPPGANYFSRMDDRDESGKFRLFGILIDIHSSHPKVRFRCGIYDYFVEIPAALISEMPEELVDLNCLEIPLHKGLM